MNLLNAIPGAIAQGMIWGIMAIGVYLTFRILDIADLTVDGSFCTGAAACAVLILNGVNPYVALAAAFAVGALAGLLTGLFHTALGIPAILAGILTQLMLWSVNLKIMGSANLSVSARSYPVIITSLKILPAILITSVFCIVLIVLLYWFFGTERGCSIRATGCNVAMSRAQGINTNVNKVLGLMLSNGLVALSGALLAQYQGFADVNMGKGAIVIGLASVIIGETLVARISSGFAVRLVGVVLGGIVYYVVYQVVIFLGLDADLLKMFSALVVAVFLAMPYLKSKYRKPHKNTEVK